LNNIFSGRSERKRETSCADEIGLYYFVWGKEVRKAIRRERASDRVYEHRIKKGGREE